MDTEQLLTIFDQDQRYALLDPRYRREESSSAVRLIPIQPGRKGFVTYSSLRDKRHLEANIRAQIERFTVLGLKFEWPVYRHDAPSGLKDALSRNGFRIGEPENLLVLSIEKAPDRLLKTASILGERHDVCTFRRITKPDALGDVEQVLEAVWGIPMPWIKQDFGWLLRFHAETVRIFVAYDQEVPVSTAWVFFFPNNRFASLYGGSTIASHRSRGLYTKLLALRAREALERKKQFLIVNAGEMSQPILSKNGFSLLDELVPCDWEK